MKASGKNQKVRKVGARIPPDIRERIEWFAKWTTDSAGAVRAQLLREFPHRDNDLGSLPTIRGVLDQLRKEDQSGEWTFVNREGGRIAFDALASLIEESKGKRRHLTIAEVEWLERLEDVAKGLSPWYLLLLARTYIARSSENASTSDLDALVAFAPWRDKSEDPDNFAPRDRYVDAYMAGTIPHPPLHLVRLYSGENLRIGNDPVVLPLQEPAGKKITRRGGKKDE